MPLLPPWLDPHLLVPSMFFLGLLIAYYIAIMGGEWVNDSLCTLGLAWKWEPLFVGLIVTTIVSAVPMLALVAILCLEKETVGALGVILGSGWGASVIPLALAGLSIPVSVRERWVTIDLPLFITYFIIFIFLATGGGFTTLKGYLLAALAVVYLIFRYNHGKVCRYGLSAFGRNFVFGASIISTIYRCAAGLILLAGGCFYIVQCGQAAVARWDFPPMALGFIAALPFCIQEIMFSFSAIKQGQGELILGRGLGLATLSLLAGGWIMSYYRMPISANDINFPFLAFIVGLFALWFFLRFSNRLWRWQAALLIVFSICCVAIMWAQGYGYFHFLSLPRVIKF